jgi:hypothetical protein
MNLNKIAELKIDPDFNSLLSTCKDSDDNDFASLNKAKYVADSEVFYDLMTKLPPPPSLNIVNVQIIDDKITTVSSSTSKSCSENSIYSSSLSASTSTSPTAGNVILDRAVTATNNASSSSSLSNTTIFSAVYPRNKKHTSDTNLNMTSKSCESPIVHNNSDSMFNNSNKKIFQLDQEKDLVNKNHRLFLHTYDLTKHKYMVGLNLFNRFVD